MSTDEIGDILFSEPESELEVQTTAIQEKAKKTRKVVVAKEPKPAKQEPVAPKIYRTYEDFDYEDMLTYAGIDTHVTSNVFANYLFPRMVVKPNYYIKNGSGEKKSPIAALSEIYADCTRPIFDFICDLELNGIHYDQKVNREMHALMQTDIAKLEDEIFSSVGYKFNLDSPLEVSELLYNVNGFEATVKTKSGELSTSGEVLLQLAGLNPMAPGNYVAPDEKLQYLANMAKRKNLASVHRSFIATYMDDYLKRDGRIHALYNQFGTSTFRLSSSEPNLQNIPRGFGVKRCFNVEKGNVFIAFDYSSAEIKLLCAISGDPNMRAALDAGMDFHSFAASEMIGVPYAEFKAILDDKTHPLSKEYKAHRQNAKALGFGLLYGSSAGGLARNLGISIQEAQRLIELYFSKFPKLRNYIESTHFAAIRNKFVVTPFGHRRQFYGTEEEFKFTAAYNAALRGSQNYVIQSATTIVGALSFYQINQELKKLGGKCVATVHDSLEAEVPIEHAAKAIEIFFYYMNDWPQQEFPWLGLSIGCEGEIGFNWEDMKTVHRGHDQEQVQLLLDQLAA